MKNANTPAMPTKGELRKDINEVYDYQVGNHNEFQFTGLTKREIIAMHCYSGLLANEYYASIGAGQESVVLSNFAKISVISADKLLAELDEE